VEDHTAEQLTGRQEDEKELCSLLGKSEERLDMTSQRPVEGSWIEAVVEVGRSQFDRS
jgi:hypothetical protein